MDKLKPILAQKFWILIFLGLTLPIVGWWMATGTMAATYEAGAKKVEEAFNLPSKSEPHPNPKWTNPLGDLNKADEAKIAATRKLLWERQLPLMTWPSNIAQQMKGMAYRAEIPSNIRSLYRTGYGISLYETWKIPQPIDENGAGLVDFPFETLNNENWGEQPIPPNSEQMWNAQEDFWFLSSLLEPIRRVNEGAVTTNETAVRQILLLELRGGSGTPGGKDASGGGAAASAPAGTTGGGEAAKGAGGDVPGGPAIGLGGGGVQSQGETPEVGFNPDDEFGSDGGGGGGAGGGGTAKSDAGANPLAGGTTGGPAVGGGGGQGAKKRYITENDKYKTRGFYMELVVDHRRLPDLLVQLADAPWPCRITRVHVAAHNPNEISGDVIGGGKLNFGARNQNTNRPRQKTSGRGPGSGLEGDIGTERNTSAADMTSALADPFLADVAIDGVITIYLPPPADPNAQPAAGTGGQPAAPGATAAPAAPGTAAPGTAAPAAPGTTTTPPATEGAAPAGDAAAGKTATTAPPAAEKKAEEGPPSEKPAAAEQGAEKAAPSEEPGETAEPEEGGTEPEAEGEPAETPAAENKSKTP